MSKREKPRDCPGLHFSPLPRTGLLDQPGQEPMTQRNYGEAPPHSRPRPAPFSMVLIGACRVHRLWPAAGQHTPFGGGLVGGAGGR